MQEYKNVPSIVSDLFGAQKTHTGINMRSTGRASRNVNLTISEDTAL